VEAWARVEAVTQVLGLGWTLTGINNWYGYYNGVNGVQGDNAVAAAAMAGAGAGSDPRVNGAGGHPVDGDGGGGGGGGIAAESGRKPAATWLKPERALGIAGVDAGMLRWIENALLAMLVLTLAAVGYTRFVIMGRGEAAAAAVAAEVAAAVRAGALGRGVGGDAEPVAMALAWAIAATTAAIAAVLVAIVVVAAALGAVAGLTAVLVYFSLALCNYLIDAGDHVVGAFIDACRYVIGAVL